jgi:hypothetical protein
MCKCPTILAESRSCAPMPFIMGVPASVLPEMKGLPMEEVVLIDLDRALVKYNTQDSELLPGRHFDKMTDSVYRILDSGVCLRDGTNTK